LLTKKLRQLEEPMFIPKQSARYPYPEIDKRNARCYGCQFKGYQITGYQSVRVHFSKGISQSGYIFRRVYTDRLLLLVIPGPGYVTRLNGKMHHPPL
jgi:hypothetical protein